LIAYNINFIIFAAPHCSPSRVWAEGKGASLYIFVPPPPAPWGDEADGNASKAAKQKVPLERGAPVVV